MILATVVGGLGNQMFEIAYAKALALKYNKKIFVDISSYKKYKIRNYSLDKLEIGKELRILNNKKKYIIFMEQLYRTYHYIARRILGRNCVSKQIFLNLSNLGFLFNRDRYYYISNFTNKNKFYLYGYFQSEKYFSDYKKEIKQALRVTVSLTEKEKQILKKINSFNSIAVSLRLGDDYVKSNDLNVCTEKYFLNAMDYMAKNQNNICFFIFSDDIEKAKKIKYKYPIVFIEGFNDYESLRLMYSCKHFIISNSSFSWWGAYLSENKNKVTIAPNRWYNNSKTRASIYLDEMILGEV